MALEVERMLVSLEARITQFEKNMDRAAAKARASTAKIERDTDRMAARVNASFAKAGANAAGMIKAAFTGMAAGAIGAFSIEGITQSIADLAKLQDVADKTGVSTRQIQEFAYAVEQSGGSVEDVQKGLEKFAVNVSKAGEGSGDLAKILEANGVALRSASGELRPLGDLLMDYADLVKNAGSEQDKMNLATAAFGRGAASGLVLALASGKIGLEEFARQARAAGLVLGDELVKKAASLDDELTKLAAQLKGLGSQFAVEFGGPTMVAAMQGVLDTLKEMRFTIDAIRNGKWNDALPFFDNTPEGRRALGSRQLRAGIGTSTLTPEEAARFYDRTGAGSAPHPDVTVSRPTRMPGAAGSKLEGLQEDFASALKGLIAAAKAQGHDVSVFSGKRTVERQAELFAAAVRKYGSVAEARRHVAPPGLSYHNKGTAADLRFGSEAARRWAVANAGQFGLNFPPQGNVGHPTWHVEPAGQRGRAGGSLTPAEEKAADRATDYQETLRESDARVAALQRERDALNQNAYAKAFAAEKARLLSDVEKEGQTASPDQVAAIDQKAAAYARQAEMLDRLEQASDAVRDAQQELASIGADAVKGFIGDLKNGASAADALRNALDRVLSRLTDNLIDSLFSSLFAPKGGGGIFASLFSGLFGGARAGGGDVQSGKAYVVGEKRPELFVPGRSGTIIPRIPTMPQIASARPAVTRIAPQVHMRVSLDGANGDETIRRIASDAAREAGQQAYAQAVRATDRRWEDNQKFISRHGHARA